MIIAVSRSHGKSPVGSHSVIATLRLKNCGREIEKSSFVNYPKNRRETLTTVSEKRTTTNASKVTGMATAE